MTHTHRPRPIKGQSALLRKLRAALDYQTQMLAVDRRAVTKGMKAVKRLKTSIKRLTQGRS